MNIILICARGGSKGLKNKNIKLFDGKPLIYWTLNFAKKIKGFDKIIISTDSKKIKSICENFGLKVPFIRPRKISKDFSAEWLAWQHAIKFVEKKYKKKIKNVLNLPVTSPNRKIKDVKKCINLFKTKKYDSVMCIRDAEKNPFFNMVYKSKDSSIKIILGKKKYYTRQKAPLLYDLTTVANISSGKFILKNNSIFNGKVGSIVVNRNSAIDIDNIEDFKYAEYLFKKQKRKK
tara:strand:+ start:2386 stop:3084 length:699 start_codon:yes stop_codon:yes gene_type:complete